MSYTYEKSNNELIEEGDYEAYIDKIAEQTTNNGAHKIGIRFRIRSDVEQKYGNRCVFEDIWQSKETGKYNEQRLNKLLSTQKDLEDGHTFESINDVFEYLQGRNVILHIVKSFDDWSGQDINRVLYYKASKNEPQSLSSNDTTNIVEEDLPF